ncbi:hypothetical protein M3M33_17155, partial [Loigolactobacillus coryniformis]|uniref:hypothetical protein n=1 Tax=Loigolactobacillus coryniformis TaxID=1610 RepID=UPI00201A977D
VMSQASTKDKKDVVKEREKPKDAEERRFGIQMLEQYPELYNRMSDNSVFYNTLPNKKSLEQANVLIDRIGEDEAERLY